jgi:hypothetical protein
MQTMTSTIAIEQMLESADHLIESHRGNPGRVDRESETPYLPDGWIVYSAECAFEGIHKDWKVELMDTTRPFQEGSIVSAQNELSLDAALKEAGRKVLTSRSGGRG